jgi:hypothetical protein
VSLLAWVGQKDLSKAVARAGIVPTNFQALIDFANSIRSPRSHGSGPRRGSLPSEVVVSQAEALLMANHVRSLIV